MSVRKRLKSTIIHRIINSPLRILFNNQLFEWYKINSLSNDFKLARIGAVARKTHEQGVDPFLTQLGLEQTVKNKTKDKAAEALASFSEEWQTCRMTIDRWERALWEDDSSQPERMTLIDLEMARRRQTEQCFTPSRHFNFLLNQDQLAPIKFEPPAPATLFSRLADELNDPDRAYRLPSTLPAVESSKRLLGPAGPEYLLRFQSPSPYIEGQAYARVYEPEEPLTDIPTLVYGSGLGVMYDQLTYWPEEEYVGRSLAAKGYRVVLLESPWHGRREKPGYCSGEPFLGGAPESIFRLSATQAQDTAVLVQWARSTGSSIVGVGGISLSGIVAQQVATRCRVWPAECRPDLVILGASSNQICRVALESRLTRMLGMDQAVLGAGWDEDSLASMRHLLDPGTTLCLPPERIIAVMGRLDTIIPYKFSEEMLQRWGIPEENIITWRAGHSGVLLRAINTTDLQKLILQTFQKIQSQQRSLPKVGAK